MRKNPSVLNHISIAVVLFFYHVFWRYDGSMDDALLSVIAPRWFLQLGSRSHEVHVGVLFGHRKDPWKWSNENLDVVVILLLKSMPILMLLSYNVIMFSKLRVMFVASVQPSCFHSSRGHCRVTGAAWQPCWRDRKGEVSLWWISLIQNHQRFFWSIVLRWIIQNHRGRNWRISARWLALSDVCYEPMNCFLITP